MPHRDTASADLPTGRLPASPVEAAEPIRSAVQYTIAELAEATHLSVRTIRAHQTRGLLAPPRRQGRGVVYGRRHLDRLETIKTLQREGYNLAAIAAHLTPSRLTVQNQAALQLLRRSAAQHPIVVANLLKHGVVRITASGNIEIAEESPVLAAFELKHLGFEVSDCVCVLAELIDTLMSAMPAVLERLGQSARGRGLLAQACGDQEGDRHAVELSTRVLTEAFRISLLASVEPVDVVAPVASAVPVTPAS